MICSMVLPYNGHAYIAAFVLLSIAISHFLSACFPRKKLSMNYYIAPLFLWIVINAII
jgi:hypothetical protein